VAVTRAFAALKGAGAVDLKDRHILVKDIETLQGLAKTA